MRLLILITILTLGNSIIYAQSTRIHASITAGDLPDNSVKGIIFNASDSLLVKGNYFDSTEFNVEIVAAAGDDYFLKIIAPGYMDTSIVFTANDTLVDLGNIRLSKDITLDEVKVTYSKPMFERTMNGISVNVEGTTLEELNTLFDVLKASPRLTSPDDESIQIIGRGSPLIRVDRQPIISNDELKAIPANQVERIEIITHPSAKYKAQGSGNGVIEVYTNNFSLEGYRMSIRTNGGVSTQKKPQGGLNLGLSFKKKKFTMNGYLGMNYGSAHSYGSTTGETINLSTNYSSNYENDRYHIWQYYNLKMGYEFNDSQRLSMGVNGHGSRGGNDMISSAQYFSGDTLLTDNSETSESSYKWLNNSAFVNYTWDTDTLGSALEINLNYINRVSGNESTSYNDFLDNGLITHYNARTISDDRPNIGELRVNYEHNFDTTIFKLELGGSYSVLLNGKQFDRFNDVNNAWVVDPIYSNSYDYKEHIGGVFVQLSKMWNKFGAQVGLRTEYTRLDGYSKSLQKQFMDSSFILPFPNAGVMYEPSDKVAFTLYYESGIDRPQFSNYDPFVRITDSLNVSYGNPYLRPSYGHTIGFETDLFYSYNLSLTYSYYDNVHSTIEFIDEETLVREETPWNADYNESYSVSLSLPIQLPWLKGWNSFWMDYNKYVFTEEFGRDPFYNLTFGFYSYLTFELPSDFSIMNRLSLGKWGNESIIRNVNHNWGIRLTKKFSNIDLSIYGEVSNLLPPKSRFENTMGNYISTTTAQNNFTSFRLGLYYKFGRLKAAANVKESSSGQSDRL